MADGYPARAEFYRKDQPLTAKDAKDAKETEKKS
jgi:hypothetical protein